MIRTEAERTAPNWPELTNHATTPCAQGQIGNDRFTWFGTRSAKSRLNFLRPAARRSHRLRVEPGGVRLLTQPRTAGPLIARLAEAGETRLVDQAAWQVHLNRLGIVSPAKTGLAVIQDPVQIATERAQWGKHEPRRVCRRL
jgi:hypothetical protein